MQKYDHYLPGLHGIRAFAAILVMIAHINAGFEDLGWNYFSDLFKTKTSGIRVPHGCHEVTIFFTLSGFLITYLLLKEKVSQKISVRKFYARRILRIWPLYYLYLIIALGTYHLFNEEYNRSLLPYYLFQAANIPMIMATVIPIIGHYWSLAVEEHFYFVFPHIVKLSIRNMLAILVALTVLILIIKFLLVYITVDKASYIYHVISNYRPQAFFIGATGGILFFQQKKSVIRLCTLKIVQVVCWLVFTLLIIEKFVPVSFFKDDLLPFATVCIIIGQITAKNKIINLDQPILNHLGKISFGIYVIHPLVIYLTEKAFGGIPLPSAFHYFGVYLCVFTGTFILAHFSYNYYESYFLKLKTKFVSRN